MIDNNKNAAVCSFIGRIKSFALLFLLSAIFIIAASQNVFAFTKIGILPYKIISTHYQKYSYVKESLPVLLGSNLASNNLLISRTSDISSFIKKNHIITFSTKNLLKVANKFKLNYIIFGRIVNIGNNFVIETNIFDPSAKTVIYRKSIQALGLKFMINDVTGLSKSIKHKIVSLSAKNIIKKQAVISSEVKVFTPPAASSSNAFIKRFNTSSKGIVKTSEKHYLIQAFTTGRFLNNNNEIQVALATRHRVILYNLALNGSLRKIAQYNLSSRSNVIYIGYYKISNNKSSIVLTKSKLGQIVSYFLVYNGGNKLIKVTNNYNKFLRVMNIKGYGRVIVGQNTINAVPSGRFFNDAVIGQTTYPIGQFGGDTYIYKFNKNSNSLIKFKKLPFYSGITLYGTTYGNIKGNGENYLLALSNSGKLMIINSKGHTIYTGSKTYGGSPLQVRVPSFGGVRSASMTGGLIYNVPATVSKFNNKGKYAIVVLKNFRQAAFLKHLNYYTKSSIYNLVWNHIGFYPAWEIKSVAGYSAGFSIFKVKGNVYLADAIIASSGSAFTKSTSYIIIYRIPA
jgi:hypothetical protein